MVSVAVVKGDNGYRNISRALGLVEKEISVTNKAGALNEKSIPLLNSMEKIPRSLSFLFLRHMIPTRLIFLLPFHGRSIREIGEIYRTAVWNLFLPSSG